MSELLKNEVVKMDYVPEYVYFHQLLKLSALELLGMLVDDPILLQVTCFKKLQHTEENYVFSPMLLELTMMALHLGATGETAEEIKRSLHYKTLDPQTFKRTVKALIQLLREEDLFLFFPVSKIFVRSMHMINMNFKILSEGVFYIFIEQMNFRETGRATEKINKFIYNQTLGTVVEALPYDFLTDSCKVVITSSVYFIANWNVYIERQPIPKKQFAVKPGYSVETEFMHTFSRYNYYESEEYNAKFLELQLVEEEGSLVIVLPAKHLNVTYLEENIRGILAIPVDNFKREMVRAEVPKFSISTTWDCKDMLKQLGINKLFTERQAEISGIAGDPGDLHVNHIVQKIVIEINEQGIGSTPVYRLSGQTNETAPCVSSENVKVFIADHPFLFYLKIRGVIALVGRFVDPSRSDNALFA